jgi:protoheme IX farnesyltransferase
LVNPLVAELGFATVILYNVMYTLYWKKKWAFGAVPGAIPGAMPVAIGYAANTSDLMQPELVYAFLIMFLWQMPHFWSLAIRFKDDYAKGGIPVLPTRIGTGPTLFHMALYMFAYVALALASPWFTSTYFVYVFVVVPFAIKVLYEFFRYYRAGAQARWLPFFLWTNFSVLVFLIAPVIDKWYHFYRLAY